MRTFNLARVAAQAELLRLRRLARRQALRAVYAGVAAMFIVAALVAAHVAGALALSQFLLPIWAALVIGFGDLIIGIVFILLASRDRPDQIEREALQVRLTAQEQLVEATAVMTLVGPMLRLAGARKIYALALAALTARFLSGRR